MEVARWKEEEQDDDDDDYGNLKTPELMDPISSRRITVLETR